MGQWTEAKVEIEINAPLRSVWVDLIDVHHSGWPRMIPDGPLDSNHRLGPGMRLVCRRPGPVKPKKPTWMAEVTDFEPMRRIAIRQWGRVEDEMVWTIEPCGRNRCRVRIWNRRPVPSWLKELPWLANVLASRHARALIYLLKYGVEDRLSETKLQREVNRRHREKERKAARSES